MADLNDVGSEYEALVRQAMGQGLQGLDCTLVQLPNDQNGHHGVVLAAVTTERGVFRAVGEAWRDLLPPARRGETLTTAEVRAKARALREALGMPALAAAHPSAVSGAAANGATPVQSEFVPDRSPAAGVRPAEAAARPTVGGSTAAPSPTGSTAGAPASLSGSGAGIDQAGSGGPSLKSATPSGPPPEEVAVVAEESSSPEPLQPAKPSRMSVDGLGTDMVKQLLKMTKQKAAREGNPAGDEEALQRLDSYFQRAFGHSLAEASSIEGKRVIQRLAADLSRTGPGQG